MDPTGGWQRREKTRHTGCHARVYGLLAGHRYDFRVKPIGPSGEIGKAGMESRVFMVPSTDDESQRKGPKPDLAAKKREKIGREKVERDRRLEEMRRAKMKEKLHVVFKVFDPNHPNREPHAIQFLPISLVS